MEKSNCQYHFCKNEIESLMNLFYRYHKTKNVLDELKHIVNIIFEKNIVLVEENVTLVVHEGERTADLLLVKLIICMLILVVWKTGNYINIIKVFTRKN